MTPQYANSIEECIVNMLNTFQFENVSILEHGYTWEIKYVNALG